MGIGQSVYLPVVPDSLYNAKFVVAVVVGQQRQVELLLPVELQP